MSHPLEYKLGRCVANAYLNKRHYYKDKNLKLVVGSLGFNGWYEFGGRLWTTEDFMKTFKQRDCPSFDVHVWLEDEEGNVYDYIFDEYNTISQIRTGKKLKMRGLLEAKSKRELLRAGLAYVPASESTQVSIMVQYWDWLKAVEESWLRTNTYSWNTARNMGCPIWGRC